MIRDGAAIAQEHRHARSPEGVVAEGLRQPRSDTALLYHAQHVAPADGFAGKVVRLVERLEEERFAVLDSGGSNICVQIRFRFVTQPDQLLLISFLQETKPRALTLQPVIGSRQSYNGTDARERVTHSDRSPVTQALDIGNLLMPPPCFRGILILRVMGMESRSTRTSLAS